MCGGPAVLVACRFPLSRLRLSRISAYLEVNIWSLFKHENLTTGNKILWKRGEIAPREQFLLFSTIFSIYLTSGVKLHIHLWNVVVRFILFPQFYTSDTSRYRYIEVFKRVPWTSRWWESTVLLCLDCHFLSSLASISLFPLLFSLFSPAYEIFYPFSPLLKKTTQNGPWVDADL